jgi:ABC-type uncharacterized transport system substrate-binding protein
MPDMTRSEFIALVGGSGLLLATKVRRARAQQPVIGFLSSGSTQSYAHVIAEFRQGLKEVGYVEGQNIAIEYRWAEEQYDQLPVLAAELVRRQVAVIATTGSPSAFVAKAATTTIPIVFEIGFDPVPVGLVASLHRPSGNLTGVTNLGVEVAVKQLSLLHELVPTATTFALLVNPTDRTLAETLLQELLQAADTLGLQLYVLHANTERDFDTVFATMAQRQAGALVIGADSFFVSRSKQLAAFAVRYAIPASFYFREFVVAGGLMSYGGNITVAHRLAAGYVDRILKGEKPADLPVQAATKYELVINLKTARALGLEVPTTLLARADEVIE